MKRFKITPYREGRLKWKVDCPYCPMGEYEVTDIAAPVDSAAQHMETYHIRNTR